MKLDLVVAGYIFDENKVLLIHHKKLDLWLPVGGHINPNETPNDALMCEIKEETDLDVEVLGGSGVPLVGNAKKNLIPPFHVNIHMAQDHEHCCFFYACKAINPEKLKTNGEVLGHMWVSEVDLKKEIIPADVKNLAMKAFKMFEKEINS